MFIIVATMFNIVATMIIIVLTRIGVVVRLRGWKVFVSRKGANGAEIFFQQIKQMKQFLSPRITSIMGNFSLISLILVDKYTSREGACFLTEEQKHILPLR